MNYIPARSAFAVALFAAGSLLGGADAFAQQARSGPQLLAAAEQSFSAIPFGAPKPQPGLTRIDDESCLEWGECTYVDANHVLHSFGDCCDVDAVVVKLIVVADLGDRPISALGIGEARSMPEVVDRVGRFLPEAKIDCQEYPAADGVTYTCGAMLGEGWFQLFFDGSRRLREVRIDAYHFT